MKAHFLTLSLLFAFSLTFAQTTLLSEDFESVTLNAPVNENTAVCAVIATPIPDFFTQTPPTGWSIDNSQMGPVAGTTEWQGWSFADLVLWDCVAGQQRDQFTLASGTIAVADPDEWDDTNSPSASGTFNSFLTTPSITTGGGQAGTLIVNFSSSWREEEFQEALFEVSFNGGAFTQVFRWTSSLGDPTFFKADNLNENLTVNVPFTAVQTSAVFRFSVQNASNDWWWAVDNINIDALVNGVTTDVFDEDFEGLTLGDSVDELNPNCQQLGPNPDLSTQTPPTGWVIDDTGSQQGGAAEWQGWSVADKDLWACVSGDQGRESFNAGTGNVLVADGDEWDDFFAGVGGLNTLITTPSIDLTNILENTVTVDFDSSWRPEDSQEAVLFVSFDGGTFTEILRWTSDLSDANYHPDNQDEQISLNIANPVGAASMQLRFQYIGENDWWWAVDNLMVQGMPTGAAVPTLGEWGLIIFGLLVVAIGLVVIGRRERAFSY